jgi:hypothetical protein
MTQRAKERTEIVKHLLARAEFWEKFPAHQTTARILRNEAYIIEREGRAETNI